MTGFLNIDKPEGKSSAYVVNIIKHVTKQPCGHLGTLLSPVDVKMGGSSRGSCSPAF